MRSGALHVNNKKQHQKQTVCFVAQHVYPVLNPTKSNFIGGAEVQQVLLAKEFLQNGFNIEFVTQDYGQDDIEFIKGFKVIKTFNPDRGVPVLRFFYPRLTGIWSALKKSSADIFYVRSAGFILAVVVCFAQLSHKKVVYCGADDRDFDLEKLRLPTFRDKVMYVFGLKKANAIIVQNNTQKKLLTKNFRKNGMKIYNGLPANKEELARGDAILWVANIREKKQPKLFLELVKRFPHEQFVMIGGKSVHEDYLYQTVLTEADKLPNLTFKGFLPLEQVEEEFKRAKIFVSTSKSEGFPNTFLQAWRLGIPVASFVDPDDVIKNHRLGLVAKSFSQLERNLQTLLSGKSFSRHHIKKIFTEKFDIAVRAKEYEKVFNQL
ncbi:MAG: glycosyltransferase family 4 protein [Candidatus Omnitrophica bacterium]|nr:glycosyltransferase family 4 protein [Candidatus Omnitrophota bacterium]